MIAHLILGDLHLPLGAAAVFRGARETRYQEVLVFARLLASSEEARGLRHAVGRGLSGTLHMPDRDRRIFFLSPDARIREERIWVKGIPRIRITLYVPAAPAGDPAWFFLLGEAEKFYDLLEAITPFPVPPPNHRAAPDPVVQALTRLARGEPVRGAAETVAAAIAARLDVSLRALPDRLRDLVVPLDGPVPEGWAALALHRELFPVLLPALYA